MFFGPEQQALLIQAEHSFTRFNAHRSLRWTEPRLEARRLGARVVAFRDRGRPEPCYNRIIGLGPDGLGAVDELGPWFAEVGRGCRVQLSPDAATPELLAGLAQRGFVLVDTQCFLAIPTSKIGPPASRIPVRRARREDLGAVFDLWAADGEPIEESLCEVRADAQLAPEFPIHLAFLDGQPAAMGTTYRSHGIGWLGNANTAPDRRRRGCHIALLEHRLWDCRLSGCRWAVTDTAFGSVSHRNAERAGMRVAFVRLELERPAMERPAKESPA